MVIKYKGRTQRVTSDGEQELTNGLIKVIQGKTHKVYLVQGHGEHTPDTNDRTGYSTIATSLKNDNFGTETIVLAQQKAVPEDASVLVIAGPKTDFFPAEVEMLKKYLAKGGKVLFLLDPPDRADSAPLTNLIALAKDWGIDVGTNIVVDVERDGSVARHGRLGAGRRQGPDPPDYRSIQLADRIPLARSVNSIRRGGQRSQSQNLVDTSKNSWAETDIKRLATSGQVEREVDKGDKAGPVSLAAAVYPARPMLHRRRRLQVMQQNNTNDCAQAGVTPIRRLRQFGFRDQRLSRNPWQS